MQRINRYHKSPPHLYLLFAVTRGDPASVAQTPSVIGRLGERAIPVWSTWSSVIDGALTEAALRGTDYTAMRTKEGRNEGNCPLFSNSPVGRGYARRWGRIEPGLRLQNAHEKRTQAGEEAAPGRISFTDKNPQPHWYSQPLAVVRNSQLKERSLDFYTVS